MTRFRRALHLAGDLAPLVAGIVAGAAGTVYAIGGDLIPALWASLATVLAFVYSEHRCPAQPAPARPPERGIEMVVFHGGPLDGAEVLSPLPHLEQFIDEESSITVLGTTYRFTDVHHTAYTATAEFTERGEA